MVETIEIEHKLATLACKLYADKHTPEASLSILKEMDLIMYRLRNIYFHNQEFDGY
jgi:hypothetical protein